MANWKYNPGSGIYTLNTQGSWWGWTIATVTNAQTRPSNSAYVAKWGSDVTGNGSQDMPFASINMALNTGANVIIVGTGVYRESLNTYGKHTHFVADGLVTLEGTSLNRAFVVDAANNYFTGFKFMNFQSIGDWNRGHESFGYNNCEFLNIGLVCVKDFALWHCTMKNVGTVAIYNALGNASFQKLYRNNTFVNISLMLFKNIGGHFNFYNNIFKNCNIQFMSASVLYYSLFHNCNFLFSATQTPVAPALPESNSNSFVPAGWVTPRPATLAEIQAAHVAVFASGINFEFSIIADPLFNSVELNDFTLQENSPARSMAFEGTFVGAKSIAKRLLLRAAEAQGDFSFSTNTNLNIANDSATLVSDSPAGIISKVIDLGEERELRALSFLGNVADRNGEWIDTQRDLDNNTIAAGSNVLAANESYLVEQASIAWNGLDIPVGGKFTAHTDKLSFSGTGVVRRISERPNRLCYEMRYSSVSAADCESKAFTVFEYGTKPTVNRTGNSALGTITAGNGDVSFNRASVFNVFARWIQVRAGIQTNNLS